MKSSSGFLFILLLLPFLEIAATTSTHAAAIDNEQISYGSACSGAATGADWDTIFQCSSSVWQRAAYFLGTSSDTCDSNHAGMMIYNSGTNNVTYCNGTSFVNFGGNGLRPTYTGVTNASVANTGYDYYACYLNTSNQVYCVGYEGYGELGNNVNSANYITSPAQVNGSLTFSKLSTEEDHSCAVTTGGAAYCWGNNIDGDIGDGTSTARSVPTAVSGSYTWTDISVMDSDSNVSNPQFGLTASTFYEASCGITGGNAYCWGDNTVGELGTGNNTSSATPVAVTGGLTFTKLARANGAYGLHMCGITSTGAAYCWGINNYGQLGNGTSTNSNSPVLVSGGYTWSMLAVGSRQTCGVTTGNVAYCWGDGSSAKLGNGSTANKTTPTLVNGSLSWSSVATGALHSCGITTSGAAYCWGDNTRAEVGLGAGSWNISYSSPVAVTVPSGVSSTGWTDISCGYYSTVGVNSGSIYSWGYTLDAMGGDPYFGQVVPLQSE